MARKNGVTTETAKRMILDSGAVYINYDTADERLFGATRDGNEFTVEQDVREIEVDGLRGPTKGFRRIIEEHVRLNVNMLEMTSENVKQALIGSAVEELTGEDVITRSLKMDDIEYVENIALVADYSGQDEPVVIILKNPLADGNFTLNAEDRNESSVEIQFTAHFDPENLDESPFEIRFPTDTA